VRREGSRRALKPGQQFQASAQCWLHRCCPDPPGHM